MKDIGRGLAVAAIWLAPVLGIWVSYLVVQTLVWLPLLAALLLGIVGFMFLMVIEYKYFIPKPPAEDDPR